MQITLDLPDELLQHFNPNQLPREILEALAVQAYQTEKITRAEVGRILGLPSRWAVDAFLKQHHADLHYDAADLERDGPWGRSSTIASLFNKYGQSPPTALHDCHCGYFTDQLPAAD